MQGALFSNTISMLDVPPFSLVVMQMYKALSPEPDILVRYQHVAFIPLRGAEAAAQRVSWGVSLA